jgi:hypothetical protein
MQHQALDVITTQVLNPITNPQYDDTHSPFEASQR